MYRVKLVMVAKVNSDITMIQTKNYIEYVFFFFLIPG